MFAHLLLDNDPLSYQVATMPGEHLKLHGNRVGFVLQEAESIDSGPVNRREVGVVGFVAGIGGESILLGGVGMDDANLESCRAEGTLDRSVVASGALDNDDYVLDVALVHGIANGPLSALEIGLVVLDRGGFK